MEKNCKRIFICYCYWCNQFNETYTDEIELLKEIKDLDSSLLLSLSCFFVLLKWDYSTRKRVWLWPILRSLSTLLPISMPREVAKRRKENGRRMTIAKKCRCYAVDSLKIRLIILSLSHIALYPFLSLFLHCVLLGWTAQKSRRREGEEEKWWRQQQ